MPENLNEVQLRVGSAIRTLRRQHDLTLEQLAERIGITEQHLGVVELGKSNVTIEILTALANEFGVSVNDLVPRPDVPVATEHRFTPAERDVLRQAARIIDRIPEAASD